MDASGTVIACHSFYAYRLNSYDLIKLLRLNKFNTASSSTACPLTLKVRDHAFDGE